jgi:primosomal replication protein N
VSGENHLVLTGQVCRAPVTRTSPAGIALTQFTLAHESQQTEAGRRRSCRFRIAVMACGQVLSDTARRLSEGIGVQVSGFLDRSDFRAGEGRLVLHAEAIRVL